MTAAVRPATAPTVTVPARPWRGVLRTELTLFRREPVGVLWGVALPLAAFVVLGLIPALSRPSPALGGGTYLAVYQAVLPLFSAAIIATNALPPVLAGYRERGVLRRYGVTPMGPVRVLAAQLAITLIAALCTGIAILVIGQLAFATGPGAWAGAWLLVLALGAAALLGLGLVIAALAPTAKVANAVGSAVFFPLMFGAGLWLPRASMPGPLRSVCDWTPLGAANRALSATTTGHLPVFAVLALAAYAVAFWLLAVRLFRWS